MKRISAYILINYARRFIPYLLTYLTTRVRGLGNKSDWAYYWRYYSNLVYSSVIGRIKLIIPLPDGSRASIRPFSQDDSIIAEMFDHKCYDCLLPKEAELVFDVGAHIGFFTIRASKVVGSKGRVISVEPLPENYNMLVHNIKLNRLDNVLPIRAALGMRTGFIDLHYNEGLSVSSTIISRGRASKKARVHLFTIDKMVDDMKIPQVGFIKIDVEGAEYDVLKGATRTLESMKPVVVMEVHGSECLHICSALLKQFGYDIELVKRHGICYLFAIGVPKRDLPSFVLDSKERATQLSSVLP